MCVLFPIFLSSKDAVRFLYVKDGGNFGSKIVTLLIKNDSYLKV